MFLLDVALNIDLQDGILILLILLKWTNLWEQMIHLSLLMKL